MNIVAAGIFILGDFLCRFLGVGVVLSSSEFSLSDDKITFIILLHLPGLLLQGCFFVEDDLEAVLEAEPSDLVPFPTLQLGIYAAYCSWCGSQVLVHGGG